MKIDMFYKLKFLRFSAAVVPIFLIWIIIFITSCRKLVEVNVPENAATSDVVYSSDGTASAVLTGIYAKLSSENSKFGSTADFTSVSLFAGLSSDELSLFDLNHAGYLPYYLNDLNNSSDQQFWNTIYPIIYIANAAAAGVEKSTTLTPSVKKQLLGEARFMRAFCYFYLVNLYGDVPLATGIDFNQNSLLPRSPQALIYQLIISDLKEAEALLNYDYLAGDITSVTDERVRPTRWAAVALLARVHLFTGNYSEAEALATSIISHTTLYELEPLDGIFKKNSKEAIWQLQATGTEQVTNTGEGATFILPSTGPQFDYPVYLSKYVIKDFEANDQRRLNWVNHVKVGNDTFYYAYKYHVGRGSFQVSEYSTVFRLAEQYLIRAEARSELGNLAEATADLNVIRARAGLHDVHPITKEELLKAILHERRIELFTEWGHRWLDLKRTNKVDLVMEIVTQDKGGVWQPTDKLYPLSLSELQRNPRLVQNPGY